MHSGQPKRSGNVLFFSSRRCVSRSSGCGAVVRMLHPRAVSRRSLPARPFAAPLCTRLLDLCNAVGPAVTCWVCFATALIFIGFLRRFQRLSVFSLLSFASLKQHCAFVASIYMNDSPLHPVHAGKTKSQKPARRLWRAHAALFSRDQAGASSDSLILVLHLLRHVLRTGPNISWSGPGQLLQRQQDCGRHGHGHRRRRCRLPTVPAVPSTPVVRPSPRP